MHADEIRTMIQDGMPDAVVDVAGADGVHFEARIVSSSFAGQRTLQRHRMVYATLGDRMGGEIHALSLRTMTPEEAAAADQ